MQQKNIIDYSPELLKSITPYLKSKHINRLWLCGSRNLQRTLSRPQVIQTLRFCDKDMVCSNICSSVLFQNAFFTSVKTVVVKCHARKHPTPMDSPLFDRFYENGNFTRAIEFLLRLGKSHGSHITHLQLNLMDLHCLIKAAVLLKEGNDSTPLFNALTTLKLRGFLCRSSPNEYFVLDGSLCAKLFNPQVLQHFSCAGIVVCLPDDVNLKSYTYSPLFRNRQVNDEIERSKMHALRSTSLRLDSYSSADCKDLISRLNYSNLEELALADSSCEGVEYFMALPQHLALAHHLSTLEIGLAGIYENAFDASHDSDVRLVESILLLLPKTVTRLGLPEDCVVKAIARENSVCKLPNQLRALAYTREYPSLSGVSRLPDEEIHTIPFWRQLPTNLTELGTAYWKYFPRIIPNDVVQFLPSGIQSCIVVKNENLLLRLPYGCRSLTMYLDGSILDDATKGPYRLIPTITLPSPTNYAFLSSLILKADVSSLMLVIQDLCSVDRPSLRHISLSESSYSFVRILLGNPARRSSALDFNNMSIRAPNLTNFELSLYGECGEMRIGHLLVLTKQLHRLSLTFAQSRINPDTFFAGVTRILRHISLFCIDIRKEHAVAILSHFPKLKSVVLESHVDSDVKTEMQEMVKTSAWRNIEVSLQLTSIAPALNTSNLERWTKRQKPATSRCRHFLDIYVFPVLFFFCTLGIALYIISL